MLTRFPEKRAFTVVELMVSTAIIGMIMVVLVQLTNQMSKTWRSSTEKIEKFQEARDGFEAMTRRVAEATLNTYWDYLDVNGNPRPNTVGSTNYNNFVPVTYGRRSGLAFTSGPMTNSAGAALIQPSNGGTGLPTMATHGIFFTAPFGVSDISQNSPYNSTLPADRNLLSNALNIWGYFIMSSWDMTTPGFLATLQNSQGNPIVPSRWRSRLMEFRLPSEAMNLYDQNNASPTVSWFNTPLATAYSNYTASGASRSNSYLRSLTENVIALVIMPKLSKNDEEGLASGTGSATGAAVPWQLSPWYIYDSTMALATSLAIPVNPGVSAITNTQYVNPKNQLPPVVEVTMVALDERSAKKLVDKYGGLQVNNGSTPGDSMFWMNQAAANTPNVPAFNKLFTNQSSDPLGTAANGTPLEGPLGTKGKVPNSDLNYLEQILIHEQLTYRIFTSDVTVRGAKWSRVQTK